MAYITKLVTPLLQPDFSGALSLSKRGFSRMAPGPAPASAPYRLPFDDGVRTVDASAYRLTESIHGNLPIAPIAPSRGIAVAVLLSVPLWIVIALVVRALTA